MISEREIYFAEQELERYQMLMGNKEYLTKEEYDFCFEWDAEETKTSMFYIANNTPLGCYLNLNLYSEHDHEKRQFEMETGVNS